MSSTLIVCSSKEHGNTQRLALTLAEELDAELVDPSSCDPASLDRYDLIGFGSGIRFMRHYADLLQLVEHAPQQAGRKAFIFSTSGFGTELWHATLRRCLEQRGFEVQGEFCCKGLDTMGMLGLVGGVNKGRPDDRDLSHARRFARRLVP